MIDYARARVELWIIQKNIDRSKGNLNSQNFRQKLKNLSILVGVLALVLVYQYENNNNNEIIIPT